jgi:hypothetical protein
LLATCVWWFFLQYKPLHWKGKRLSIDQAPVLQFPVASLPFVVSAVSRFSTLTGSAGFFWQLPGETSALTTTMAEGCFDSACGAAGFSDVDLQYTLYSTRCGSASAAAAVGVPLHKIEVFGGWGVNSKALRECYLDHAVPADSFARMFFAALVHTAVSPDPLFDA